jgi:hypothetical protein
MEMTNEELIQKWKNGEEIKVIEMGGLGPTYELGIWKVAMVMLEFLENKKMDWETLAEEVIAENMDELEQSPEVLKEVNLVQPSGAMYYAALNVAAALNRNGYEECLKMVDESRIIPITDGSLIDESTIFDGDLVEAATEVEGN